jgi:tetratricopeptide (TPR) repeat protein
LDRPIRDWRDVAGRRPGCYMEVAVNTSCFDLSCSLRTAALFALLLLLTGCSNDMITHSKDFHEKGMRLLADKSYPEASGAFREAVRQEPRDFRSHYYLGICYEQMQEYGQAIKCYRTGLSVMGTHLEGIEDKEFRPKLLDALAMAVAKHDPRDVELNAIESQARVSNRPEDLFLLAKVHRYRGDADSAVTAYRQANLGDPKNFLIAKDFGLYLLELNQIPAARSCLISAYRLNQNDAQVNDGLRRIDGVEPGPSLKAEDQLVQPVIPKGPIPEVKMSDLFKGGNRGGSSSQPLPPGTAQPSPRD